MSYCSSWLTSYGREILHFAFHGPFLYHKSIGTVADFAHQYHVVAWQVGGAEAVSVTYSEQLPSSSIRLAL